jgi:hypothetical protein
MVMDGIVRRLPVFMVINGGPHINKRRFSRKTVTAFNLFIVTTAAVMGRLNGRGNAVSCEHYSRMPAAAVRFRP